eukprot:12882767-Prorocentrum_lima.AAC.1
MEQVSAKLMKDVLRTSLCWKQWSVSIDGSSITFKPLFNAIALELSNESHCIELDGTTIAEETPR